MKELLRSIDSLNHLAAFEASARLGSFTNAARELGVSQPAISQSIRRLEAAIGTPLFHRRHRIITLTDAGERLNYDVSQGLTRILHTVKDLQQQGRGQHVTLSVSTAFANYWMVPRLQDFHQKHPDIDLRVQTTDKDLDLAQEGISLGVWRGTGHWTGYATACIAKEVLMPMCSPAWLADHGPIEDISALADAPLITLDEPFRARPKWEDFFHAQGHRYRDFGKGLRLNDYALVLQATMAGEGIALGWRHVTKTLRANKLLASLPWTWHTDQGFYLVWSDTSPLSADAKAVRDWIIDQADVE